MSPHGFAWVPVAEEPAAADLITDLVFACEGHSARVIWAALVVCLADCLTRLPKDIQARYYEALPDLFVETVERLTRARG